MSNNNIYKSKYHGEEIDAILEYTQNRLTSVLDEQIQKHTDDINEVDEKVNSLNIKTTEELSKKADTTYVDENITSLDKKIEKNANGIPTIKITMDENDYRLFRGECKSITELYDGLTICVLPDENGEWLDTGYSKLIINDNEPAPLRLLAAYENANEIIVDTTRRGLFINYNPILLTYYSGQWIVNNGASVDLTSFTDDYWYSHLKRIGATGTLSLPVVEITKYPNSDYFAGAVENTADCFVDSFDGFTVFFIPSEDMYTVTDSVDLYACGGSCYGLVYAYKQDADGIISIDRETKYKIPVGEPVKVVYINGEWIIDVGLGSKESISLLNKELPKKADITYVDEKVEEKTSEITKTTNNSFSNAIKGTSKGNLIQLNDVSPVEHNINIKMWNDKNLFPKFKSQTKNGVEITVDDDGTIHLNGTCTTSVVIEVDGYLPYDGWFDYGIKDWGEGTFPDNDEYRIQLSGYDEGVWTTIGFPNNAGYDIYPGRCFDGGIAKFGIGLVEGFTYNNCTIKPSVFSEMGAGLMFEHFDKYYPCIDQETAEVTILGGRNLVDVDDKTSKGTSAWKSVLAGTFMLPPGTYNLSADFEQKGELTKIAAVAQKVDDISVTYGLKTVTSKRGRLSMKFTIPDGEFGTNVYLYSNHSPDVLNAECTFSNIAIEIVGEDIGLFEEYRGVKQNINNVTSVSPSMTIIPYADVKLKVEYIKDTNKVIEELTNAIISLGGNV